MGVIYSRSRPIGSLTARRYARAVLVGSFAVPIVRGHPGIPRDWTPCSGPQRASRSRWQPPRDHPRVHRGARDAQDHVDHHLAHHHCVSGRGGECGANSAMNSAVMRSKAKLMETRERSSRESSSTICRERRASFCSSKGVRRWWVRWAGSERARSRRVAMLYLRFFDRLTGSLKRLSAYHACYEGTQQCESRKSDLLSSSSTNICAQKQSHESEICAALSRDQTRGKRYHNGLEKEALQRKQSHAAESDIRIKR